MDNLKNILNKYAIEIEENNLNAMDFKLIDDFLVFFKNNNCVLFKYVGISKNVILPSEIKEIYSYAFYGNKNIEKLVLNDNLTIIGSKAISCCENLEEIVFPKSLSYIDSRAFDCDYNLKKIEFLNPKIKISSDSFEHCYELNEIVFYGSKDEREQVVEETELESFKPILR